MAKKTTKKTRTQIPSNLKRMLDRLIELQYEKLYGFYCTGVARGLQQTKHTAYINLPSSMQPREAWAFAYGMRYASNPLLDIEGFKRVLADYFKSR